MSATASPLLSLLHRPADALLAENWTAAQFAAATAALAVRLRENDVRAVALWFDDGARFASALLAAWQAGAEVYLPPNLADANRSWADQAGALWLSDDETLSGCQWHYGADAEQAAAPAQAMPLPAADARLRLKTSGSSGEAKVIEKTFAQMQAEAAALSRRLPQEWRGLTAHGSVSPQHLYGLSFRIFAALACGWVLGRRQCVYPEDLIAASKSPCIWIASPALLNRLGEVRDWPRLRQNLRGIVSAGGMLPDSTAQMLHGKLGFFPHDVYGSTETGAVALREGGGAWTLLPAVSAEISGDGTLALEAPWTAGRQQTADAAELAGSSLKLLGRQDRIIKFEDKRVSLNQIEHDLLDHPWTDDAHCGRHPQHGRIAAWVALNAAGIAAWREQGRPAVIDALRRHLAQTQDTAALPRYWRFAAALPRNPQAKIGEQDFQAAFTVAQTAPQWRLAEQDPSSGRYRFSGCVPLDLAWFGGHFATFPLVPGVIEVQWAMDLAASLGWANGSVKQIENLKYQHFVRPNDTVDLTLRYDEAKRKIHFSITQGDTACASGRVALHG